MRATFHIRSLYLNSILCKKKKDVLSFLIFPPKHHRRFIKAFQICISNQKLVENLERYPVHQSEMKDPIDEY